MLERGVVFIHGCEWRNGADHVMPITSVSDQLEHAERMMLYWGQRFAELEVLAKANTPCPKSIVRTGLLSVYIHGCMIDSPGFSLKSVGDGLELRIEHSDIRGQ